MSEAAGKKSTIKEGGLAKLVFGKGESESEKKANDAEMEDPEKDGDLDEIAEESSARTDMNGATVKLDDI